MGLFNKPVKDKKVSDKLNRIQILTSIVDGLPIPVEERPNVRITCDGTQIIIEETKMKVIKKEVINTYRIKLENVLDVIVADKKEIINMNKSVIGRGVAGALVFGPVGAMLGGMSGIGAKQKTIKTGVFLVISYKNKDGEIANITFRADQPFVTSLAKTFVKEIKRLLVDIRETGQDIEL